VSRFGDADRLRRPQGDLDTAAASWTMMGEEGGSAQPQLRVTVDHLIPAPLWVWPGVRRAGRQGRARR
jgi:hypothetical protein